MSEELSELEAAVLDLLLSRSEDGYDALQAQRATCSVRRRELTGVGFFTDLEVSRDTTRVDPELVGNPVGHGHDHPEDVFAEIEGLRWGATFLLWLEDGAISQLEGTSFAGDHPWPDPIRDFTVRWEPINRIQR